jgi:hypothetical protein
VPCVEELSATGRRVQAVEARASVRERLRREGVDARLGGIDRFTSVADTLESFLRKDVRMMEPSSSSEGLASQSS